MDRKEFLSLLSASSATVLVGSCLASCGKGSNGGDTSAPTNVDFTLDLTQAANASLLTNGGYTYSNGVIVAKTTAGAYIAVSQKCTHEGTTVTYQSANSRFYCPNHGSTFTNTGAVTTGPATVALKQYNTSLTGNSLRIYS